MLEEYCDEYSNNASIYRPVTLFYADGSIFTSPNPERLQEALGVLTGLFDQVGLIANVEKMAG